MKKFNATLGKCPQKKKEKETNKRNTNLQCNIILK